MRYIGIFNRDGGTFKTTDMDAFAERAVRVFAAHGHQLDPRVVAGDELLDALKSAAAEADALLVGGGDGTISAAAAIAYRRKIPLAVIPAGTMNLFARALHIPLELDAALEALAGGEVRTVDIAEANGQPFIHQFSVGVHAKLVKLRAALPHHSRFGKMLASVRAMMGVLARPPIFHVDIRSSTGERRRTAAGIAITNNPFTEDGLLQPDGLNAGILGLYVIKPLTPWSFVELCVSLLRGHWKSASGVETGEVREVTIHFPRRHKTSKAVLDGELIGLDETTDLTIHPGGLQVVLPIDTAQAEDESRAALPAR